MKPKAIICDLDGTICNGEHRQHYVKNKPKNWAAYNKLMHLDTPIQPVIDVLLYLHSCGIHIIFCSGRQDKDREVTETWLRNYEIPFIELHMRPTGEYVDDTIVKERIYHKLKDKYDIIGVFDDRKKVKRKWVELGVFVFDVNQHDVEF